MNPTTLWNPTKVKNKILRLLRRSDAAREESSSLLASCVAEFCEKMGLSPEQVEKDGLGRPYFPTLPYSLSVTHSGDLFAAAFAPFPIGVDAEPLHTLRPRVAARYFTPQERLLPFARVWTAREALSKCTGRGLSDALAARFDGRYAYLADQCFSVEFSRVDGYLLAIAFPQSL